MCEGGKDWVSGCLTVLQHYPKQFLEESREAEWKLMLGLNNTVEGQSLLTLHTSRKCTKQQKEYVPVSCGVLEAH